MTLEQQARQFWEEGFLHLPSFCGPALMDELDGLIHAHFGDQPDFEHTQEFLDKSKVDVVPWFPQRDGVTAFDAVEADPRLQALTQAILGAGFGQADCMVMFSAAGSNGQSWHQDCPPEDPTVHNLNRLIYTRDITDATGGQLVLVPRSHRWGELPPGDPVEALEGQRVFAPNKGDLVLVHGHAWHRVLPTADKRTSTNFRAVPEGTSEGVTDICVYRTMRYRFSTSEVLVERA